ncbi:MAG: hypothetical protein AAFO87_05275, partial [Cyanobacteria bacterium J06607_6]
AVVRTRIAPITPSIYMVDLCFRRLRDIRTQTRSEIHNSGDFSVGAAIARWTPDILSSRSRR